MIEVAGLPVTGGVTLQAVVREACRRVVGIVRVVVVLSVARPAICGCAVKLPIDVAFRTIDRDMCARKRELRVVVVERRRFPRVRRVAHLAVVRVVVGQVIIRAIVVLLVT